MRVNADFGQRVVLHGMRMPWVDSPVPGVQRRMLDRIGDEVARATSLVRYAPGSQFTAHTHGGGEEFVVLEGVFQDEHGDYPAGHYIRNPPTSRHAPGSAQGCIIFVKLWQFDPRDRTSVIIDMNESSGVEDPTRLGVTAVPLFDDDRETVRCESWLPGTEVECAMPEGAELLVLAGTLVEAGDTLEPMSWLRLPRRARMSAVAGPQGVKLWVKTRHLRFVAAPVVP